MPGGGSRRLATAGLDRAVAPDTAHAAWVVALLCGLGGVLVVWLAGPPLSHVLYPARPPLRLLPGDAWTLTPEPFEGTRYLLAVAGALLMPVWILALAGGRLRRSLPPGAATAAALAAQTLLLATLVVCFVAQHGARWRIAYFTLATLVVAALLALLVVLALRRIPAGALRRAAAAADGHVARAALAAALASLTAVWLLPGVNTERSMTWAFMYHDTAFHFDETFAVINGLTPLADFNSQYASLFSYATALALLVFGKTVPVFTIAVCTLSALILLAVYGILRRAAGSRMVGALLYLPFLATTLFDPFGSPGLRFTPGTYFPMFPFRYGGPYLLAWLVARQLGRAPRARVWLLFGVAGLVVLNNFEFGVPALGATVAALLIAGDTRGASILRLGRHAAAGLAAAVAIVALLTLARAGELPDLARMPRYSRLYGVAGYSVEPLPGVLGLPLVMFATYAAALGVAAVRAIERAPNRVLTGMLAWVGVFGLGAGSYYVARSIPALLPMMFSAWALALALLTIVAVRSLRTAFRWRVSLPALAVLFGMGLATCSVAQMPLPWIELDRLRVPPSTIVPRPVEWSVPPPNGQYRWFVSSVPDARGRFVVRRGAPVALFATTGHRIADAYGIVNVVPYTGAESMHTAEDLDEALQALRDAGGTTVLLQLERARVLFRALERRGFRAVTTHGIDTPGNDETIPLDTIVMGNLTKWVDTRRASLR